MPGNSGGPGSDWSFGVELEAEDPDQLGQDLAYEEPDFGLLRAQDGFRNINNDIFDDHRQVQHFRRQTFRGRRMGGETRSVSILNDSGTENPPPNLDYLRLGVVLLSRRSGRRFRRAYRSAPTLRFFAPRRG